jgi:rhamnulokinase
MIGSLGLPASLLPQIVPAGTDLGPVRRTLVDELELEGLRVVAPATHDTGSAVAGAPLQEGWAYISSGTWSLVGVELDEVLINSEVAYENFTNEGGAFGTIRFLKNVMGLWILECCRAEWKESGLEFDYDDLSWQGETIEPEGALIFPDDPRFLKPASMLKAMSRQLAERDESLPDKPPAIARMILDSLALRYASVLRTVERLTNRTIKGVHIVGGGSQNDYLNQATANATGKPVLAGPVEATVIGNVLVQAITSKRFPSLAEARRHVAVNTPLREFTPRASHGWEVAGHRYAKLEADTQVTYAF